MHTLTWTWRAVALGLSLLALGVRGPLAALGAEDSLAQDARVGVVVERHGLAFVRPAARTRWTPLNARSLLFPGDRLRTESRGAHALEARLAGGGRLTLGPGVLLDVASDGALVLFSGEAEALGTSAAPVRVRGAAGGELAVDAVRWLTARDGKVLPLAQAPAWLTGYRARATDEWMGSLLATLDGKQVPLHVGTHQVEVEILDQVARTTVTQTFRNDGDERLEGTFRFPLPAEASISGFGMWIGSELVEADVVERERARQIYEDILRRKKDPGLLEWAGGNVFQARVFPIEPRSEKRVRLRYTEVLPLEGDTWRYRYALRSELLRLHPLRELSITVRAASTAPLASVTCPTHPDARVSTPTPGTALVELSQREVKPERDFEVAGRLERGSGLTVVTHRRGQDAWFMLLLQSPDTTVTGWQRDVVPEGEPLDLILALDTSGSVEGRARQAVADFSAALLGSLGTLDRVRVCALDTELVWLSTERTPGGPEATDAALRFLEARRPMGWTDLDRAAETLVAAADPGAQVVFVTDGIGTSGDGDPQALAERLRRLSSKSRATFHAVAPSSAYERPVLEALASLGGGSVRHLGEDPADVARRLVTEVTLPLLRDLKVEVQGLSTARVYPQTLPNLPVGAQHTIVGRFLPSGAPSAGTVVVSGTLAGQSVRFTAPLRVPGDQEGNSFLPRLWARRHLDFLLEQGDARAVKEDVVRLSTEHGILTPYTSLLVLESDEDRERYGVERRVHARDGEVEFAAARDTVALETLRQATKEARAWRVGLRRRMLAELAHLGRDVPLPELETHAAYGVLGSGPSGFGFTSWGASVFADRDGDTYLTDRIPDMLGRLEARLAGLSRPRNDACGAGGKSCGAEGDEGGWSGAVPDANADMLEAENADLRSADDGPALDPDAPEGVPAPALEALWDATPAAPASIPMPCAAPAPCAPSGFVPTAGYLVVQGGAYDPLGGRASGWSAPRAGPGAGPDATDVDGYVALGFPPAVAPRYDEPPPPEPPEMEPALAAALRRALGADLPPDLALRIAEQVEQVHPRRGTVLARASREWLRTSERWFLRQEAPGEEPLEFSLLGRTATHLNAALRLARASEAGPHAALSIESLRSSLGLPTLRSLEGARVEGPVGTPTKLRITRRPAEEEERWTLGGPQGALTEREVWRHGELVGRVAYLDVVDVGGAAWPTRIESSDADGRLVHRVRMIVQALAPAAVEHAFAARLAGREDVITLPGVPPTAHEARERLAAGQAGFVERLALALERSRLGNHSAALASADEALALVSQHPGRAWLRAAFLERSRAGAALRTWVQGELSALVGARPGLATTSGDRLLALGYQCLTAAEVLALVSRLEGPWTRDGTDLEARWVWRWAWHEALARGGRPAQARAALAAMVTERPGDPKALFAHVAALAEAGDPDAAAAFLGRAILAGEPWADDERDALEAQRAQRLLTRQRWGDLLPALEAWTRARPDAPEAWSAWVSMLHVLGRESEADAWLDAALTTLGRGATFARDERARLTAALALARGRGWGWSSERLEPRRQEQLLALTEALSPYDDGRLEFVATLLSDQRLATSEVGRNLRQRLRAELSDEGGLEQRSLARVQRLLGFLSLAPADLPVPEAERLLQGLHVRLKSARTTDERGAWVALAEQVLGARGLTERVPALLSLWLSLERGVRGQTLVRTRLLSALQARPHDLAGEAQVLALLRELWTQDATPWTRAWVRHAHAMRSFVPWAVAGRAAGLAGTPEQQRGRTRAQTRTAEREAQRAARAGLADALAAFQAQQPAPADARNPAPIDAWERLGLLAENGTDLEQVARGALRLLSAPSAADASAQNEDPARRLQGAIERRAAALAAYAVTRRASPPGLADEVLAAFRAREHDRTLDGRYQVLRLLLALDRIPDLIAALTAWASEPRAEPRWVRTLALLHAELGRVPEAVALLEPLLTREGALSPADLDHLARWLLVSGDDARRARVRRAQHEAMHEGALASLIWTSLSDTEQPGTAAAASVSVEALEALPVLLRKASWPQQHVDLVQRWYATTKDHRLLSSLVEGLAGHGLEATYQFLGVLAGTLDGVHEEATLDALRAANATRRTQATDPVERRAHTLLAVLIDVRASRVLLKDPTPIRRALEALLSAVGPLAPDEARPLANLLASFSWTREPSLEAERLRQLSNLAGAADVASGERLEITLLWARALAQAARRDEALDRVAAAADEARRSGDLRAWAQLPVALDFAVEVNLGLSRFAQAEALLNRALEQAASPTEREEVTQRVLKLYPRAVRERAALRLGRGSSLVREALGRIEAIWAGEPNLATAAHEAHIDVFAAAIDVGTLPEAAEARVRFAHERLPALLRGLPSTVAKHVAREAQALALQAHPREALRYLLDRQASEPAFFRRVGADVWSQQRWSMAQWRSGAGALGALEPRLLALVLADLEGRIRGYESPGGPFWSGDGQYRWVERRGDFVARALALAEEEPASSARQVRVARELLGMGAPQEAIALLNSALARGALDVAGRQLLAQVSLEQGQFALALRVLEGLLADVPDSLPFTLQRVRALAGLARAQDVRALLTAGVEAFAGPERTDGTSALMRLGRVAGEWGHHDLAVPWLEEGLTRAQAEGWTNEAQNHWRPALATSLAALGHLERAVDHAAIVAFAAGSAGRQALDPHVEERELLEGLFLRAPDLETYVRSYEARVARDGQDAPLIRRALIRVYAARPQREAETLRQAEALRLLVPDDAPLLRLLVSLYDRVGRTDAALDALESLARLPPGDTSAWEQLGQRLAAAGKASEAERAFTSLVEQRPDEPEGHRRLARARTARGRLQEAARHWRHVTRLRPLEPEGRLEEAKVWIAAGDAARARASLSEVLGGTWEERFAATKQEAAALLRSLP